MFQARTLMSPITTTAIAATTKKETRANRRQPSKWKLQPLLVRNLFVPSFKIFVVIKDSKSVYSK